MFKNLLIAVAKWAAVGYCLDTTWVLLQDISKNSPSEALFNMRKHYFKK